MRKLQAAPLKNRLKCVLACRGRLFGQKIGSGLLRNIRVSIGQADPYVLPPMLGPQGGRRAWLFEGKLFGHRRPVPRSLFASPFRLTTYEDTLHVKHLLLLWLKHLCSFLFFARCAVPLELGRHGYVEQN